MMEWLTFISTLILAGITLAYVLLTRKMVKINQEMLKSPIHQKFECS